VDVRERVIVLVVTGWGGTSIDGCSTDVGSVGRGGG